MDGLPSNKILMISGIILFVVGTSVFPVLAQNMETPQPMDRNWLYVGGSGPGNYATIREALENALTGDTIFVYDDASPYIEHYLIVDKSINIIGENKYSTIIDGCKGLPIFIVESDHVMIHGFHLKNTSTTYDGIRLNSASFCSIYDNIISYVGRCGIDLHEDCTYNNIFNNIITNTQYCGINLFDSCYHNSIYQNEINGTEYGIIVGDGGSNSNHIANNTCYDTYWAIFIENEGNTIADNTVIGGPTSNAYGITISTGSNNLIIRNTVLGCHYGVNIQNSANNNIFSQNNLIQCWKEAKDPYTNIWDLGYSGGGNYYSSYAGPDNDNDGIGDSPFEIPYGDNLDYYPLINPFGSIQNLNTKKIYRTIQFAINDNVTQNGDTIYLQKSIFHETINITKALKIQGEKKGEVIIDASYNGIPISVSSDNVSINQLQIQNSGNQNNNCGIFIHSNGSLIRNSTILNCTTGIYINQGKNNHIYHNNFIQNILNAWSEDDNSWDNGYPSGGNYWEDYNGTDANGDGIGDTPYDIAGGTSSDKYPYMHNNGWLNHPPSKPSVSGPAQGTTGVMYSYTIESNDPDGNNIFYLVDWGDNSTTGWIGPISSGISITVNHSWSKKGSYIIQAKAKDTLQAESLWGQFNIFMPFSESIHSIYRLMTFLLDTFLHSRFINVIHWFTTVLDDYFISNGEVI